MISLGIFELGGRKRALNFIRSSLSFFFATISFYNFCKKRFISISYIYFRTRGIFDSCQFPLISPAFSSFPFFFWRTQVDPKRPFGRTSESIGRSSDSCSKKTRFVRPGISLTMRVAKKKRKNDRTFEFDVILAIQLRSTDHRSFLLCRIDPG